MKIRQGFFLFSVLATILFQAGHATHTITATYAGMTYENLLSLPSHILFLLPHVLLALASSERAISIFENKALILGRLSGRKEFAQRVLTVLAQDIAMYGSLHVATVIVVSLLLGNGQSIALLDIQTCFRVILLNAVCSTWLFVLSLWTQRSTALMAGFSSMAVLSSAGLAELHRWQPFFYRFNLFVSCMIVDDREYSGWLAIVLWTLILLFLLIVARMYLKKGEFHD